LAVQVWLHSSIAGRAGNLLVLGGGSRHPGHHGVPAVGGRRVAGLLCAEFYIRGHFRSSADCQRLQEREQDSAATLDCENLTSREIRSA
jgi:hypothetical protein